MYYIKLIDQPIIIIRFVELDLNKISIRVFSFNIGVIKCYERMGFKTVEVIESKENQVMDFDNKCYVMEIMKDEIQRIDI